MTEGKEFKIQVLYTINR